MFFCRYVGVVIWNLKYINLLLLDYFRALSDPSKSNYRHFYHTEGQEFKTVCTETLQPLWRYYALWLKVRIYKYMELSCKD